MIILVMGMHRSGTSALAGMLHSGGVFMGEHLVGKSRNNPKGHFEDRALLNLDNRILNHFKGSWRDVPDNMDYISLSTELSNKMHRLNNLYRNYSVRGWKDPRMAVLFSLWYDVVLNSEDIVFLHIVRHPEEVAQSLAKRHRNFPKEEAFKLCKLHNLSIESHAKIYNIKRLVINFSDLVQFPRAMKEKVENFTGVPLDAKASKFVEKKHKHWNTNESATL